MLKQRVADAINAQINAEFYSAYLYLSMSAYISKVKVFRALPTGCAYNSKKSNSTPLNFMTMSMKEAAAYC